MKKIIISFCLILSVFSTIGCNKKETNNNIEITIEKSSKFSEQEINSAVETVKSEFKFPACTLTKIWYDEDKSNRGITSYLCSGRGYINKVDPSNVIILLSEFYVDDSGDNPVLEADTTYSDYNWILIRDSKTSKWKIDDCGY